MAKSLKFFFNFFNVLNLFKIALITCSACFTEIDEELEANKARFNTIQRVLIEQGITILVQIDINVKNYTVKSLANRFLEIRSKARGKSVLKNF